MQKMLTFIDSTEDFDLIDTKKINSSKIFSFNIFAHKSLEEKNIGHEIAENYLKDGDHEKIFDYATSLWNWYDADIIKNEFEFENVNLLSVADTSEFHQIIIREIFNFIVIKRILEKEQPKKINLSPYFAKIIKQIDNELPLEIFGKEEHDFHIQWEKMLIRFNILNRPISIPISRKRYNQFKNFFESVIGNLFGLWQNFENKKQSILLLEFNPAQYSKLLDNLKNFDGNIIFFNRRRPAGWNLSSIKLLRKYNIKLISPEHSLSKNEKIKINSLVESFTDKLDKFLSNESALSNIFKIEGINFWPVISDVLKNIYKRRITEYLQLVLTSKQIFSNLNIKNIISLNILGETEKTILMINNNKISSILLEHGATNYLPSFSKYDISNMYPIFKDKIALWGDIQKEYLLDHRNIPSSRIFVTGSPRHEDFFDKTNSNKKNPEKIILITPQAMSEFNGLVDTNTYLKLEKLLVKIFQITKTFSDIKTVVKMHPTLAPGNEYVKTLIHKLNPDVEILQLESVLDVVNSCDIMININTEFFPSTIVYEGLILNKPIMNITMMDEFNEIELVTDEAVLSISDNDDLEEPIKQILFDQDLRKNLIANGQKHLKRYFSNHKSASEELAKILTSD